MKRVLRCVVAVLLVIGLPAGQAVAVPLITGDLLVADQAAGTIRHYSAGGADLGVFASGLSSPAWISADRSGNIYVPEFTGARVDKFSTSGVLLLTIPTSFVPGDVQVASNGLIYVADYFGGNVFRYSDSGAALGLFVSTGRSRADFLALDASGNLYVSDFFSGAITRISPAGVAGTFASLPGAEGMTFDATGNLYVSSFFMNIIEKFSPSGVDLGTFASTGLNQPYGLAFDRGGNLYAANFGNETIRKFSPAGTDLGNFVSAGLINPRDLVFVRVPEPSTLLLLGVGLAGLVFATIFLGRCQDRLGLLG
jgi:streptogramin lyase